MAFLTMYFISLAVFAHGVHAYWRMSCGLIQTGRLDPVVNPGSLSGHVHKVSGANSQSPPPYPAFQYYSDIVQLLA